MGNNRTFPESVKFEPWIGASYDAGVSGQRVLLVGESCYSWTEGASAHVPAPNHVIESVRWRLDGNDLRFLVNIERTFLGQRPAMREIEQFWQSVALHEYIQRPMADSRQRPAADDWSEAKDPFKAVVEALKPSCIFVFGFVLWEGLPAEDTKEFLVGEHDEELWCCGYNFNSFSVPAFRFHHPSRAYNPAEWFERAKTVLRFSNGEWDGRD